MTELLIVAILLGVFGIVCLVSYWRKYLKRSTQKLPADFSRRIMGAKEELAKLLGAPGSTDMVELDTTIANWLGSSDKRRHLVGLCVNAALEAIKKAERHAKCGGTRMLYAEHNLKLIEDLLSRLRVQIDCLEPQE